jgi:hypothetical protein
MPSNSWVRCPADRYKDGYNNTSLRNDVAEKYNALYQAVHDLGGVITSAGGRRSLDTVANSSSQSKTSLHYIGRAFDMALSSGMNNPSGPDPFVIMPTTNNRWVVWCKSSIPPNDLKNKCIAQGIEGGSRIVMGAYMANRKMKIMSYSGIMFNFTALAKKFGFDNIAARQSFTDNGIITGAEWWHFQDVSGLEIGVSTFGQELLRLYDEDEASAFVYWDEVRDAQWGVNWRG